MTIHIGVIHRGFFALALTLTACSASSSEESASSAESLTSQGPSSSAVPMPSAPNAASPARTPSLLGTWAYEEGSHLVVSCGSQVVLQEDLHRAGAAHLPGTFVFRANEGGLHEIDGLGCEYHFRVDGASAVGDREGQSCARFPDGKGGVTKLVSTGVTKALDVNRQFLNVRATAKIGPNGECDLLVTGTARRIYD